MSFTNFHRDAPCPSNDEWISIFDILVTNKIWKRRVVYVWHFYGAFCGISVDTNLKYHITLPNVTSPWISAQIYSRVRNRIVWSKHTSIKYHVRDITRVDEPMRRAFRKYIIICSERELWGLWRFVPQKIAFPFLLTVTSLVKQDHGAFGNNDCCCYAYRNEHIDCLKNCEA